MTDRPSESFGKIAGWGAVLGGIFGVLGPAWLLTIADKRSDDFVNTKLSSGTFTATELLWTLTHILLFIGVLAWVRGGFTGSTKAARVAAFVALIGFALQIPAEFGYAFVPTAEVSDTLPVILSSVFGLSMVMIGIGLIVAGVDTRRQQSWSGWRASTPLAWGVLAVVSIVLTFVVFLVGLIVFYLPAIAFGFALASEPIPPK
jgi:hypothetical protein